MRIVRAAAGLAVLLAGVTAVAEASHVPGAPPNDDYLQSFQLNQPGSRLDRTNTLKDPPTGQVRNTSNASVQSDVFRPDAQGGAGGGGPAEVTNCKGVNYGRTVWYDFYPDIRGFARVRTSGYDTVISVVPFNARTGVPDFARRVCINAEGAGATEELFAGVGGGRAYTIQVGAVGNVGGNLTLLFDFLADRDGDGVLDDSDRCDRFRGPAPSGCPPRLRGEVTLRAKPTDNGIEIVFLRVAATRRARVTVTCAGCGKQVRKARTVGFGRLRGKNLRAGTSLVVRVTKRNSIGAYTRYKISRGNFRKIERCLNPGSRRPRRRCG